MCGGWWLVWSNCRDDCWLINGSVGWVGSSDGYCVGQDVEVSEWFSLKLLEDVAVLS